MQRVEEVDAAPEGAKRRGARAGLTLLLSSTIAAGLVASIFAGLAPPAFGLLAVAIVLTTVFWLIRDHLPTILLVFVSVLLVSVVGTQQLPRLRPDRMAAEEGDRLSQEWQASGRFDQKLPVVVHLVMDEMMSTGAMTDDLPGGAEMRRSMLAFGEKHSLRTYDSVYSRYYFSAETLPNLVNPEYRGQMNMSEVFTRQQGTQKVNAYFEDMARRGYRTAVFQSALLNFCDEPNVDMCETLNSFDPGEGGAVALDARNQRVSLWLTMLRAYAPSYTSDLGQTVLTRIYGLRTRPRGLAGSTDRYDVQRFPAWFDRFTRFVANVPRGTHVFAHFLVPHSPRLLSESCVVNETFDASGYLSMFPPAERDEKRRWFYADYFAQLGCVERKLDDLMTAISQSEKLRDATIIIHGDHGSRISIGYTLEDYTRRDFVDNYATFYAVRSPAITPGVDCEFVSLPEIFRRHMVEGGRTARGNGPPLPVLVTSRDAGDAKVEAAMPLFGCATGTTASAQ